MNRWSVGTRGILATGIYNGGNVGTNSLVNFTFDISGSPGFDMYSMPPPHQAAITIKNNTTNQVYATGSSWQSSTQTTTQGFTTVGTLSKGDSLSLIVTNTVSFTQEAFATNYTAAELSNIKVAGVTKVLNTDYYLYNNHVSDKVDIVFDSAAQAPAGTAITADVTPASNTWTTTSGIETSLNQIKSATDTMRTNSKNLSNNSNIMTTREDFTDSMISILQTGAANLTLADMNEEGSNMLMLQTRQNLCTTSLSMAAQASQSVLRLF